MRYQTVIGLEIHVELNTKSKMFCSCSNDPNEKYPNVNVCPICLGHPGTLPVINNEAIKKVIKTGLSLNCQIAKVSKFDRKNYFYPDLPKGYQISQYDMPLSKQGFFKIDARKIRIRRVHLEEDTGRLVHPKDTDYSLVDFNRAGIPLMELVTEPDLRSAKEAKRFAQELQLIFRYLRVSNADMEKGQLRVEANISLTDSQVLGTKVEIKNLNSFKAVEKGIEYEIKRQTKLLKRGEKIIQETRGWDEKKEITVLQRKKEEEYDYRYFPEPNLPELHFESDFIDEIKKEIPELPQKRRERFKKEYNLLDQEIESFVQNIDLGEYFEKVVSESADWVKSTKLKVKIKKLEKDKLTKLASNYILTDLQALLKGALVVGEDFLISPENFAEFISMIFTGEISSKIAKIVLKEMFSTGADPSHIIEEKGLAQLINKKEIEKIVKEMILKNQKAVKDFKKGKANAFQFMIGQVMQKTKGRANPDIVKEILKREIGG